MSQRVFEGSVRVTSPLVDAIATQDQDQKVDIFKVMEVKVSLRQSNHEHQVQQFKSIYDHLSPQLNEHQVQQFKSIYDHLSLQLNEHQVQQFKSVYDDLSPPS